MDNKNLLIAGSCAGFALAGVAGYLYLNKEDDVKNENKELKEKPELNDLLSSVVGKDNISSVWSNFWGEEHKKQRVMEELKEKTNEDASIFG